MVHTELRSLELVEVLVCAQQALHSLDVLFLREARKVIQVVQCRVQHPTGSHPKSANRFLPRVFFFFPHQVLSRLQRERRRARGASILGLVHVLAIVPALRYQRIQNEGRLGQCEGVDILELSEVEIGGCLLITRGRRLGSRGSRVVRHDSACRQWRRPDVGALSRRGVESS